MAGQVVDQVLRDLGLDLRHRRRRSIGRATRYDGTGRLSRLTRVSRIERIAALMPRHLRLKVLVSLAVGVAAVLAVPALGSHSGLVPLASWGSGGEVGPHIESIAATEDGSIVMADRKRDRVVRFTYDHALAGSFAATDPRGIAVVPVTATCVRARTRTAHRRRRHDPGDLSRRDPYGVALAGDTVLIADASNGRILRYRIDGTALPAWDAGLVAPRGLATGPDGTVYVADAGSWRIETFDADGKDTGGWRVPDPHGVAVDATGTVYVASQHSGQLLWFAPAARTPAPSAASRSRAASPWTAAAR